MKQIIKLNIVKDFEMAKYEGFTLQKGFYYGRNLRGQAIASSGWQCNGLLYLYTRGEHGWEPDWVFPEVYGIEPVFNE